MLRSCGLTRCDEIYLDGTGHQDVVMHFTFGSLARDLVLDWMLRCRRGARLETNTSQIRSQLQEMAYRIEKFNITLV